MWYRLLRFVLRNLFRAACAVATLLHPGRYSVSRPREANSDVKFDFSENAWWLYKYYFKQVERPEPDAGIEEHFAKGLDFPAPTGFAPKHSARVAAAGDILVSDYISGETTSHVFDDVEDFLFDADVVCANLESPVAPSQPFSAIPKNLFIPLALNNSAEVFDRCYRGGRGINLFTTANNHSMDRGEPALVETLDFLDERGALHVGTSRSAAEADDFPVVERGGVRIAFLSHTFSLNGRGFPTKAQVNHLRLNLPGVDLSPIERQISRAKRELRADIVVLCLHWGLEFESFPTRHFIETTRTLWELGADVVVGNHAHGIQPAEAYLCADPYSEIAKPRLAFYALGDLLSWHPAKNTRMGLLAKFTLQKGTVNGETIAFVSGAELLPTYLYSKVRREVCSDFRVLRLWGELPAALTNTQRREVERLRALQKKVVPYA